MDRKPVEDSLENFISNDDFAEDAEMSTEDYHHHEKPDKPVGDKRRKLEDYLEERRLKKELEDIDNWDIE